MHFPGLIFGVGYQISAPLGCPNSVVPLPPLQASMAPLQPMMMGGGMQQSMGMPQQEGGYGMGQPAAGQVSLNFLFFRPQARARGVLNIFLFFCFYCHKFHGVMALLFAPPSPHPQQQPPQQHQVKKKEGRMSRFTRSRLAPLFKKTPGLSPLLLPFFQDEFGGFASASPSKPEVSSKNICRMVSPSSIA